MIYVLTRDPAAPLRTIHVIGKLADKVLFQTNQPGLQVSGLKVRPGATAFDLEQAIAREFARQGGN